MSDEAQYPLVTFALFAYNQEKYIREAVEGALAQDYPNLEIIISDDCSTDGTYDIAHNCVARYKGRHSVHVLKNASNVGLMNHVLMRGREAMGEIVVVAAGDDVSHPSRVSLLTAALLNEPGAIGIDSLVNILDEDSKVVARRRARPLGSNKPHLYLVDADMPTIQGCAAAYRRDIFNLEIDDCCGVPEDVIFAFYSAISGRPVLHLSEALVGYRMHPFSLSNNGKTHYELIEAEARYLKQAQRTEALLGHLKAIAMQKDKMNCLDWVSMVRDSSYAKRTVAWQAPRLGARVTMAKDALLDGRFKQVYWMLLRLFGSYPKYQPRTGIERIRKILGKGIRFSSN